MFTCFLDEKSKISTLTLLCEYLRIFTKSEISFPVLDSMDYVNYLLSSLITIVEFDVIDLSLLEDYSFKGRFLRRISHQSKGNQIM